MSETETNILEPLLRHTETETSCILKHIVSLSQNVVKIRGLSSYSAIS